MPVEAAGALGLLTCCAGAATGAGELSGTAAASTDGWLNADSAAWRTAPASSRSRASRAAAAFFASTARSRHRCIWPASLSQPPFRNSLMP